MIRVISGIYKGKRLNKVKSSLVRPIPDKLKETLFNIIRQDVKGSLFLDGFAGTGSVGIEALSRGAENVVFIDEYYPAIKVIKANLKKCEVENRIQVIHQEFNRGIIQLAKECIILRLKLCFVVMAEDDFSPGLEDFPFLYHL